MGCLTTVLVIWGIYKWTGGGGEILPASTPEYGNVTLGDQSYRTIELDGLTWMAENLNYEVVDSWCYENKSSNCNKYGRLYNWEAANKACQTVGWHLPTDQEWQEMAKLYGGADDDANEGGKAAFQALIKDGKSGFNALLGGWRSTNGSFAYLGFNGRYWSATEDTAGYAWYYDFYRSYDKLYRDYDNKSLGFSCRCVKGAPSNGID